MYRPLHCTSVYQSLASPWVLPHKASRLDGAGVSELKCGIEGQEPPKSSLLDGPALESILTDPTAGLKAVLYMCLSPQLLCPWTCRLSHCDSISYPMVSCLPTLIPISPITPNVPCVLPVLLLLPLVLLVSLNFISTK